MISGLIAIIVTIAVYLGSKWCYKRTGKVYLTPLLVAPIILIAILAFTHIPYSTYNGGAKVLTSLLQPATVAFAIPLYKFFPVLKKHAREILSGVVLGSFMSIFSAACLAVLFGLNSSLLRSIMPYSVTTPIAMGVSQKIGGIPTITAVFVIITGILGSIIGPFIIRLFRINSEIARGVLLGTSSHGAGTSKALEMSSISGAISSVCMVLAAIISFCASPLIATLF
jgi:predicted murein hydrolase (TIGR00659 family)